MDMEKIKGYVPSNEYVKEFLDPVLYWFRFPDPDKDDDDNIWHDFHIFDGHEIEIQNRVEWYESPHVPKIYKDHVYIFKKAMEIARPTETFYYEKITSGAFEATIEVDQDLPSGSGKYKIETNIKTKSPPEGENNFAHVEYFVKTFISYDMPKGISFLPRILARPLNRFFRWAFLHYIGEEMIEYDGEFAREKTNEYFHYLRKYHGEEPTQTKTRQATFKPVPEEGVFFQ